MDIDKLFESESLDGIADNVFGVVNNSVSEVKEMQRKKVAENVQLVVNALKKIESDISSRYDSVGNALEKRIITIKDGRDGADGRDGRNGKDGKNGRDGAPGPRGADGKNGLDGADGTDGVSVTNAHIDFDGSLVISLSSGHELNVGEVVAPALAEQIKVITNGGGTSQSVIDTLASLQAQITALGTAAAYKGLWNASTNTPTLASGVGTSGNFYIVSVAGSTNLDGITNWGVGDWAIYNGTAWQRVEGGAAGNFTTVTASSLTSGRVTYAGTAGLLQDSANLTFNGTTLTANTIGAFTLGGTVAGGGNQLNNVVIGTTTPLAGNFTTLSASSTATLSGLTASAALALDASKNIVSVTNTGSGNNVLATSPTITGATLTTSAFNGTVGATTPSTGAFTTLSSSGAYTATANIGITRTPLSSTSSVFKTLEIGAAGTGTTTFFGQTNVSAGGISTNSIFDASNNYVYATSAAVSNLYMYNGSTKIQYAASGTAGNTFTPTTIGEFSSTGLAVTGTLSSTLGATIYGLTVGRGGGAVSTNTVLGNAAFGSNLTGGYSVAIGTQALQVSTAGYNTAVGYQSQLLTNTGQSNVSVGYYSLVANLSGGSNTAIGTFALGGNTTASNNTAIGYQASYANTTGTEITSLGWQALKSNTTGNYNTAVGGSALGLNISGSNNTAIGRTSLANSTASDNTAVGFYSLALTTSGASNTAVGVSALQSNTTASNNTAVGYQALYSFVSQGGSNTAVGYQSLYSTIGQTGASSNTGVGYQSGYGITTGYNNLCVGYQAGYYGTALTSGLGCVYIGAYAGASSASVTSELVINAGGTPVGKGASTGFISPGGGGVYQGNNSTLWSVTSDQRLKKNIVDNNIGLEKITAIQVRNFEYRLPEEVDAELKPTDAIKKEGVQLGVIAQELQAVLPDCVKTESTGVMSVNSDALMWHMINAIKELSAKVTALENK